MPSLAYLYDNFYHRKISTEQVRISRAIYKSIEEFRLGACDLRVQLSSYTGGSKKKKKKKKMKKMLKSKRDTCADQRVFTYLYFSHARIRAARICLINTFPDGLSRGYSNFSWGHAAVRRNFDVARISKNRFSPLSRIFQPITRGQNPVTTRKSETKPPPLRSRFLFTSHDRD